MRGSSQVARRALGLLLVGTLCLACTPVRSLSAQIVGAEAGPPLVLPTHTPSFRVTPSATAPLPTVTPAPVQTPRPVPSLWIGGEGCLTTLGPEGWRTFDLSGIVRDIAVDVNGHAVVAPGLRVCDGRLLRDLLPHAPGGEQDAVAIDSSGRIWVGHYGGIAVLDEGRWLLVPIGDAGTSARARTVRDLAIDARGVVWVATGEGLAAYDGHSWQQHSKPGPGPVAIERLFIDPQGRLWVAHEKGLSALQGDAWAHYALDAIGFVREIAADAAGRILVGGPHGGLSLYDGQDWQPWASGRPEPTGERITALAGDRLGRLWVGTRAGLSVFDGGQWLTYQEASSGLADDRVSALAVGRTPATLPAVGPIRYGQLTGQVTVRRQPLAGVRVVLCTELAAGSALADIPCQGSGLSRVTRTGIDGRFAFEQVPLGHYAVAAELEPGHWVTQMRVLSPMHYRVREGETTVVDAIEGGE